MKEHGLDSIVVVGTFLVRAVAPLLSRAQPMYKGASDAGSPILTRTACIPDAEVAKRLRKVLNVPAAV